MVGPIGAMAAVPFTVVALPDTQYYTQTTARNEMYFKGQTRWIVNNRGVQNIKFVMGLGDIQNDGNPYYARADNPLLPDTSRPTGFVADYHEWDNADASLKILDAAGVPYSVVAGNHDYLHHDQKLEPYNYLKYFGPARFAGKSYFGGGSPATSTSLAGMNSYYTFDGGGRKFLNIGLQFAPDTGDLTWAQSVVNANPGVPTIITTHAMLDTDSTQSGRENIFNQFVKNNPQVVMTMNGHITGAYRQTQTNIAGTAVQEMLVDYQFTEYPGYYRGGGYLRLLQFDTDNSVVHVKSYSPVIGNYLTDSANQFDLPLNMQARFGVAPGTGVVKPVSFRQGVAGYAGTHDGGIDSRTPTVASGGTAAGIWVDGDSSTDAGSQPRQGLIRFDGAIGSNGIPAGSAVRSGTLTLTTGTVADAQTNSTMSLYRLLVPWTETSTWNSLSGGITANGTEAILAANGTVTPTTTGSVVTFDVAESLSAWAAGAPNYGWVLLPGGTDGWYFNSSEALALTDRPLLTATYETTVPEPAMAGVAVLAGIGLLGRRRRA